MKNNLLEKIKNLSLRFLSRKRYWMGTLLIALLLVVIIRNKNNPTDIIVEPVAQSTIQKTVVATGEVTSQTNLNLSFDQSGEVKDIRVKVGDIVKKGQILATIDQLDEQAELTQARGALLVAQANYKKALRTLESAEGSLENVTREQEVLVRNAERTLLSDDLEAIPESADDGSSYPPVISGTYNSSIEGDYVITMYASNASSGYSFRLSGLETGSGTVSTTSSVPLGTRGLYIKWPEGFEGRSVWVVSIPNKRSSSYVTNLNAYNLALETQKTEIDNAKRSILEKQAEFSNENIESEIAYAEVISAQGKVDSAQAKLEKKILRAPAPGTITAIDISVGELAKVEEVSMVLQDVSNLYFEGVVNEENISLVKVGQTATITLDAFGDTKVFNALVKEVDLSATKNADVVNYKITATFEDVSEIKAGMTATATVLIDKKENALSVPVRAVYDDNGTSFVYVVVDDEKSEYSKRIVTTGLLADGALQEITSGISFGESVVTSLVEQDSKK